VTHPYLADPERAAAFAYLVANPSGSRARWAKGLSWSPSKVQRFIEALLRFRLAEIEVNPYFTHFNPLVEVEPPKLSAVSDRSAPGQQPIKNRSAAGQAHLEALDSGYLVSRYGKAPAKNGGNAEAMTCIAVVNEVLGANFGQNYTPISHDNHGSHRAVQHWIEVGIPLDAMTRLLRMKAAVFNPSKINGDMPRSLASSRSGSSKSGRSSSASSRWCFSPSIERRRSARNSRSPLRSVVSLTPRCSTSRPSSG
jgi:hypothetical protein